MLGSLLCSAAMEHRIVAVAATKGGVGKTTLAYELAYALDAVLVDLDWDAGGATRQWGYRPELRQRAPLLDALQNNHAPRPIHAEGRPPLLPSHPDFAVNQPEPSLLADKLTSWASVWNKPFVVVDTHPGAVDSTFGALAAASVVVVPVVMRMRELAALEAMVQEFEGYPLLVVPNMVPYVVPSSLTDRLAELVRAHPVPVAPPVSEYRWWGRRQLRAALTSYDPVPARLQRAVNELNAVADTIRAYVNG